VSIVALVALFAVAMVQRDRIRAQWWAWRLTRVHRPADQAYYASSLAAVGDAAVGATRGLTRDGRADVRSIAVAVLGHLPASGAVPILATLLADPRSRLYAIRPRCRWYSSETLTPRSS